MNLTIHKYCSTTIIHHLDKCLFWNGPLLFLVTQETTDVLWFLKNFETHCLPYFKIKASELRTSPPWWEVWDFMSVDYFNAKFTAVGDSSKYEGLHEITHMECQGLRKSTSNKLIMINLNKSTAVLWLIWLNI